MIWDWRIVCGLLEIPTNSLRDRLWEVFRFYDSYYIADINTNLQISFSIQRPFLLEFNSKKRNLTIVFRSKQFHSHLSFFPLSFLGTLEQLFSQ